MIRHNYNIPNNILGFQRQIFVQKYGPRLLRAQTIATTAQQQLQRRR